MMINYEKMLKYYKNSKIFMGFAQDLILPPPLPSALPQPKGVDPTAPPPHKFCLAPPLILHTCISYNLKQTLSLFILISLMVYDVF